MYGDVNTSLVCCTDKLFNNNIMINLDALGFKYANIKISLELIILKVSS